MAEMCGWTYPTERPLPLSDVLSASHALSRSTGTSLTGSGPSCPGLDLKRAIDSIGFRRRGRLAALAIAFAPVTALVGCAAAADAESGSSDAGYSDPGYSDPGYTDPGYTDPCAFAGNPLCPDTPIHVPPPNLGPPGGW